MYVIHQGGHSYGHYFPPRLELILREGCSNLFGIDYHNRLLLISVYLTSLNNIQVVDLAGAHRLLGSKTGWEDLRRVALRTSTGLRTPYLTSE